MSFIDEMQKLRADIDSSKKLRSRRLEEISGEVKTTRAKNRSEQRELRKMFAKARTAFWQEN